MSDLYYDPAPWALGGTPTHPAIIAKSGVVTRDVCRLDKGDKAAFYQRGNARLIKAAPEMHDLLLKLADTVYALDGTNRNNEAIVDEYKKLMARLPRSA